MASPHHPQYPHYPQQPPRIDPKELRPGRIWFFAGAVVLVLGLIGGIVGFIVTLFNTVSLPELQHRVQESESVGFELSGTETVNLGLYSNGNAVPNDCVLIDDTGLETGFDPPGYSHNGTLNGESWRLVALLNDVAPGEYTLDCRETGMGATYALGDIGDGEEGILRGALTGVGFMLGLPAVGLIAGVTIMVMTGVRRSRHRRQLIAERAQGQPGWPGHPGGPGQHGGYPGQPGGYPGQPGGYPGQPGGHPGAPPQPPGHPGRPDTDPGRPGHYRP